MEPLRSARLTPTRSRSSGLVWRRERFGAAGDAQSQSSPQAAGIFLIGVVVLAFILGGPAKTWADPDLWGHIRFGADIFRNGLLAVAIGLALVGWKQPEAFTCLSFDGPWMPEREARPFLVANALEGRLLSWFDWGQYAIWHFAARLKVSPDGRREAVYSEASVTRHLKLIYEPDTSMALLDELRLDYAWLPANLPLSAALNRAGWRRIYTGPISIVFAHEETAAPDLKVGPTSAVPAGAP